MKNITGTFVVCEAVFALGRNTLYDKSSNILEPKETLRY